MDITSPTLAQTAQAATTRTTALTSDFDTFLRMLTVQIRNQDPLNPIRSNQLLTTLTNRLSLEGAGQAAGWIGLEARVQAPVRFDGYPVPIETNSNPSADRAMLVVHDSTGALRARDPIAPGQQTLVWQGLDARGAALPHGEYRLSVESYAGETLLSTDEAEYLARIDEVRIGPQGAELYLSSGQTVAMEAVRGLRKP